ncbi:MAG: hypothetical protein ACRDPM_04195 [Solirubrobacteraceae bacterium]
MLQPSGRLTATQRSSTAGRRQWQSTSPGWTSIALGAWAATGGGVTGSVITLRTIKSGDWGSANLSRSAAGQPE